MADPAPVAQTFFIEESVQECFRLDGIVTLVDAKHIEQHLDEEKAEGAENEAVEQVLPSPTGPVHASRLTPHPFSQVAFADRLLLNKVDLVDEGN